MLDRMKNKHWFVQSFRHSMLLRKMEHYGITITTNLLFKNIFLTGKQFICFNGIRLYYACSNIDRCSPRPGILSPNLYKCQPLFDVFITQMTHH